MTMWQPSLAVAGDTPIYLTIVAALEDAIRQGELAAGSRLPAQRELAKQFGVTVSTVSRAFLEAQRRGLIDCTVGSGSYVCAQPVLPFDGPLNLRTHAPAFPEGMSGQALLEQAMSGCLRGEALSGLLSPEVSIERASHREAAVQWLRRCGVAADDATTLLLAGAQHGQFCALAALVPPGGKVLCDSYTNTGFLLLARQLGLQPVSVASDAEGLLPDAVAAACEQTNPAALYYQPTWANPTGRTMSVARRAALAAVLRKHDLLLIEDDDYGPLAPDGLPTLASLAPEQVIYLASLSKSIGFGMRLAYAQVPARWYAAVQSRLRGSVGMVSPLVVELAASWQRQGLLDKLLRWRRDETVARGELAHQLLGVPATAAGLVWLPLPAGWRADRFVAHMEQQGVLLASGDSFAVQPTLPGHVRLTLGAVARREALERGLRLVAAALRQPPELELM